MTAKYFKRRPTSSGAELLEGKLARLPETDDSPPGPMSGPTLLKPDHKPVHDLNPRQGGGSEAAFHPASGSRPPLRTKPTITMSYCPSMKKFLVNCPGCDDLRVASMNNPLHICGCGSIFWTCV